MTEEINFYRNKGENGWMSNFFPARIEIDGVKYITIEHYYQSKKAKTIRYEAWIANAPTPYLAAVAGRALRADRDEIDLKWWEENKVDIMRRALRTKFKQHPDLARLLDMTGDAVLHEDSPTDKFWGKKGKDMLGKLLMEIRDELRRGLL
jgi:ribA/ribD-fused uncharacterized protein